MSTSQTTFYSAVKHMAAMKDGIDRHEALRGKVADEMLRLVREFHHVNHACERWANKMREQLGHIDEALDTNTYLSNSSVVGLGHEVHVGDFSPQFASCLSKRNTLIEQFSALGEILFGPDGFNHKSFMREIGAK